MDTAAIEAKFIQFDDRLRKLETDNARTDERYKKIMETLESIQEDVATLKNKPARRWDVAINSLVNAIIAAVVGFLAGRGV